MLRREIKAKDIENLEANQAVKIFDAYSDYIYVVTFQGSQIYFNRELVWDLGENGNDNNERYPGWQDDAKSAIVKHNNARIPQKSQSDGKHAEATAR